MISSVIFVSFTPFHGGVLLLEFHNHSPLINTRIYGGLKKGLPVDLKVVRMDGIPKHQGI